MAYDGIVNNAIVYELNSLIEYKIDKIYEPNKNTVVLGLYGNGNHLAINICIDSNNCRMHLTTKQKANPNYAPNFCMLLRKHLIGGIIKAIKTVDLERLAIFEIEALDENYKVTTKKLIVELMGKHSNIILANNENKIIDSLRHTSSEEHSYRDIFPNYSYMLPTSDKYSFLQVKSFEEFYNLLEDNTSDQEEVSQLRQNGQKETSPMGQIANTFNGISNSFIQNSLKELHITEINEKTLRVLYDYINFIISSIDKDELDFKETLNSRNKKDYYLVNKKQNDNYNLSFFLDDFYYNKETTEQFTNYRNAILKLILDNLKKYNTRLKNINEKLEECSDMDTYKLYGELITSNLYRFRNEHLDSIDLENYYDNNNLIIIPLDKKYTIHENAKRYFKKYNKLKNALDIVTIQKQDTLKELDYMESIAYELEAATTLEEIQDIFEEISENVIFKERLNRSKSNKKKNKIKVSKHKFNFSPLKFVIDDYTVLVGRNNKENDYLTTKFANRYDYWFHTKDTHGSHVILRLESEKELVPDDTIVKVAKLAKEHSKGKDSNNVPVDYCKVQYVKKPNGSKPGMVIFTNNKTINV